MKVGRAFVVLVGAGVLVLGAVGLTGFLTSDDYCISEDLRYRMWPPGMTCTSPERGELALDEDTGSAVGFVVALVVGAAVAALAARLGRRSPASVRLAAVLVAVFALAGVGALAGAVLGALWLGLIAGSVAAYLVDRALRPVGPQWEAGLVGWLVGVASLFAAGFLWLLGLGIAAFAVPLVLVVVLAALVDEFSGRPPSHAP